MFLKVSLTKRVMRFGVRYNLSPRFVSPFEIIERIDEVAYKLTLVPPLASVYNMSHVSILQMYVPDPRHIIYHTSLQFKKD